MAHRSDPTKSSGFCSSTSSSHVAASSPIPAGRSGDGREGIVNSGESNNPGPLLLQLQSTTRDWQLRSAIGVRSPLSAAERMWSNFLYLHKRPFCFFFFIPKKLNKVQFWPDILYTWRHGISRNSDPPFRWSMGSGVPDSKMGDHKGARPTWGGPRLVHYPKASKTWGVKPTSREGWWRRHCSTL